MNQTEITRTTISLLRCFLTGEVYDEAISEELRSEVYTLANKHDVAHLITDVLEKTEPLAPGDPLLQIKQKTIYRYAAQDYERERIYALFERNAIAFIPLKGSVINNYYPNAWHRVGCDIDILIHEEQLEQAIALLTQELSYREGKKSEHDVSLMSPTKVHLELHYDLHEVEVSVEKVWDDARPVKENSCCYAMSAELFLFHHIAHMAKHCRIGGCGLRPFIDLWLLRKNMPHDQAKLDQMLSENGLTTFADAVYALMDFWFGDGQASPLVEQMAEYILPAGAYGSVKNRVAIGQIKQGSKFRYFLSRLLQSREALEYPYPILRKHGWLIPFCQVHRWVKLLLEGKSRKIVRELRANESMDREYKNEIGDLLSELELHKHDDTEQ